MIAKPPLSLRDRDVESVVLTAMTAAMPRSSAPATCPTTTASTLSSGRRTSSSGLAQLGEDISATEKVSRPWFYCKIFIWIFVI